MPKSKHQKKRKKRYYKPKYHGVSDICIIPDIQDNRLTPKVRQRVLNKSVFANEDSLVICDSLSEKMSEILMDYADPLLMKDATEDDLPNLEKILEVAILIWNYSILKNQKGYLRFKFLYRLKIVLVIKLSLSEIGKRDHYSLMMKRKQMLYPDNNRIIAGIDVSWDRKSNAPYLAVMSTVDKRISKEIKSL